MGAQVERLLKVIVPKASARREKLSVRSPVSAPVSARPHDSALDQQAELAAMRAKMEALQLADERRQAEIEALQAGKTRLERQASGSLVLALCERVIKRV